MSEKAMSLNFDLTGNGTARRFAVRVHQNGARTDCGFEEVVSLTELEDKARQLAAIIAGWHQEQDLPVEEHEHPGGIGDGLYEKIWPIFQEAARSEAKPEVVVAVFERVAREVRERLSFRV